MKTRTITVAFITAAILLFVLSSCGNESSVTTNSTITPGANHSVSNPPADAFKTELIAGGGNNGEGTDVGDVWLWLEGDDLHVKALSSGDWYFNDVADNLKIYASINKPTTAPPTSQLNYKFTVVSGGEEVVIPDTGAANLNELYVLVHGDMAHMVLDQNSGGGGYGSYSYTYGLYYGNNDVPCGDVVLTIEGDYLVVTFNTDSPWWLRETQVYIGTSVPPFAPGQWTSIHSPVIPEGQTVDKHYFLLSGIPGSPGDEIYMAFHASIVDGSGLMEGQSATAWNPENRIHFIVGKKPHWKSYTEWTYPYPDDEDYTEVDETAWGLDNSGIDPDQVDGWFRKVFWNFQGNQWGWVCSYPPII